jgi:hypothetical protein
MEERILTCDLQMDRETPQVFFAYFVSALGVRPLWHGRRQFDNPFPPISAAAGHNRFQKWQRKILFTAQADPVVQDTERSNP